MSETPLSHVRADGSAVMVDVSGKEITTRIGAAYAEVHTRPEVAALLVDGKLPKGDVLAVARVAGIMAAKKTPELIPLCHPLAINSVTIDFTVTAETGIIAIHSAVKTEGKTGVEMEALTAASVAALTIYDMIKAVDHLAVIKETRVESKSGGKSGDWSRPA